MPIMMQRNMVFMSLFGLNVNSKFNYDRYFQIMPAGPEPAIGWTQGFFDVAMSLNPKPQTVALVGADAEYPALALEGARAQAKRTGLKVVYDKSYPPNTVDFSPIVRAIQATNPDLVVICSYPLDSVGMVQAVNEAGLNPKMIGGAMVGLQSTVFKMKLGPALNGFMNYDIWLPAKSLKFNGTAEYMQKYQERAAKAGVDPLGYYMAPFSYSYLEVLGQAITETKGLDDAKLADAMRKTTFKTIVGDVKFAPNGEWAKSRVFQAQFRGIKGNGVDQFKNPDTLAIITPAEYKSGNVIYPYEKARQ
jgi:branched-chain amino acid transport system substrate-binding protein